MSFYQYVKYAGSGESKIGPFQSRDQAAEAVSNTIMAQQRNMSREFIHLAGDNWASEDGTVEVWIEEH